jgi:orotidine 5'-phosphate decarboxylase subfamily 2
VTGGRPPAGDDAGQAPPRAPFATRLATAAARSGSLVCVGLDPHPGRTPAPVVDYCRRIIDATAPYAMAYKPNSAFFEALGTDGLAALRKVIAHVPDDRITILDAKRGDIGSTAEAYAHAAFGVLGADALTVSPYLGRDGVVAFLADPARGAFVLCHTSNPGASEFQELEVGDGPLFLAVARRSAQWNANGNLGLVVGATYPAALAAVREVAPELPFLVPGVGAQGGDIGEALRAGLDAKGGGVIISSSRAVFYAADPAAEARTLRDRINAFRTGSER